MIIKKIGSLQIEPEAASQSLTFWIVQKIALIIISIFLLLVLLGFTGSGLLNSAKLISSDHSYSITYDPFSRATIPNKLKIQFSTVNNETKVYLSTASANRMQIKKIIPKPSKVALNNSMMVYTFLGSSKDYLVTIFYEYDSFGKKPITISNGSESVSFNQWVMP